MSLVGIHAMNGFETEPLPSLGKQADRCFIDADGVLFENDDIKLYKDADDFLGRVNLQHLAIVTANPDSTLNEVRRGIVNPAIFIVPQESHLPKWSKYHGYQLAAHKFIERGNGEKLSGIVIDDRWLMGSVVGSYAVKRSGYDNVTAVFIDRGEEPENPFDRALSIVQEAGVRIAKSTHLDVVFRPRQ